jgi:MATE family multidrug resistance protein
VDQQPEQVASTLALIRRLFAIAAPTVLTQLGLMGFGLVDTLMLGRLGVAELDAAALGNVWIWGLSILGIGTIFGLDPIMAQANGRADAGRLGLALQQGLVVSAIVAVPLMAAGGLTEAALLLMGQEGELAGAAQDYVLAQIWSVAPLFWFYTLRQYLQSREIVTPALWLVLLANVFNAIGNEVLIFGIDGLVPAMGLRGAAIATGCTRTFLAAGLGLWIWRARLHEGGWESWTREALRLRGLLEVLRLGLPIGVQYGLETWAFQASTLLAGELGREALAAHSIVLNTASITFMVPLGISFGASTIVGNLVGQARYRAAQRTAWIALGLGGGVQLISALLLTVGRTLIPSLYTDDALVIVLAAGIFPIAAAFQLFDGLQAVGGAILRGNGDTLPAALFNAVAYYAVALPLAAYLVLVHGLGLQAIWWSLALGLALVAAALTWWVHARGPAAKAARE